ncbi:uncharacterized protein A1O9_08355 [Exophiala aquamarina CBS 119918]|uniref:Major facilitator superfamily (MFS) profile domain-containing protein n=1 Tax=Exophiala aquamarina CBS 119918 TaxID=1182545 RepID=A0A072PJ93_9EURO|nr:uncharacterized protein A1O9_08355 [Exophiala aquamarina CBS 119918]KEF55605.1 hypothetical protein A1O9_08355 [Exophiala aquamarina CBS 119918]
MTFTQADVLQNWKLGRKALNFGLVLTVTLVVFTALSVQVIVWQQLVVSLNVTFKQLNNSQSIFCAGLAMGTVVFMPFAIKYGRRPVYIISTAIVFAMSVWSSRMDTLWELYLTNLIMGLAGATNEAIIGCTIADLFFVHQRATMNGIYLLTVVAGNFLTPMLAGVHATASGWRWVYYVLSIFTGFVFLAFIFLYEETKYIPLSEGQQSITVASSEVPSQTAIEREGGSMVTEPAKAEAEESLYQIDTGIQIDDTVPLASWKQRLSSTRPTDESLRELFYRPVLIMFRLPIVAFAAFQYSVALCWLVNIIVVLNMVFPYPPYNFTPAQVGYMCLGPFTGFMIGTLYGGPLTDKAIVWFAKRNHGYYEPEMRLYLLHLPCVLTAAGIIMFGVTTAKGMHWIVPAIGGAIYAAGGIAYGDNILTYVIDSHKLLAGEAFVTISFWRNLLIIVMAQIRIPWMIGMGLQNMFILSGFLSLALTFLYVPMIYLGKRTRRASAKWYYQMAENRI